MSPVEIPVTDDLAPLGVDPEMHEAVSKRAGSWSFTPFDTRSIRNRDVLLFFKTGNRSGTRACKPLTSAERPAICPRFHRELPHRISQCLPSIYRDLSF